jgi:hypothetical protein
MDWTRADGGEERTLHRTDGSAILNSVLLPRGVIGATLVRNRVPDGFAFIVSSNQEVATGVYFMVLSQLTGAPALGSGTLPTTTLKRAFTGNPSFGPGAVLVGDTYHYLEPTGGVYPAGSPAVKFSSYDLGSDTFTQGPVMPACTYQGLCRVASTQESGTPLFLIVSGGGEGVAAGIYSYDTTLNTLTLLVKSNFVAADLKAGLFIYTGVVGAFPLRLRTVPSPAEISSIVELENSNGTPSSVTITSHLVQAQPPKVLINFQVTDADYDLVNLHGEFSINGGTSWNPATLEGGNLTEFQSLPDGAPFLRFWDSSTDVPVSQTTLFRLVLDAPADSVGVTSNVITVGLVQTVPVPRNEIVDKVNSTNLAKPLAIQEASGGTEVPVNREVTLVILGTGLTVKDEFGDPRVRAVALRGTKSLQVFDFSRFTLVSSPEGDVLNLRVTISEAETYSVLLLDKDGSLIAVLPAAFKAG